MHAAGGPSPLLTWSQTLSSFQSLWTAAARGHQAGGWHVLNLHFHPLLACPPTTPLLRWCTACCPCAPPLLQELGEPAFAHNGMVAAAQAIFDDMLQRGILQQVGGWVDCLPHRLVVACHHRIPVTPLLMRARQILGQSANISAVSELCLQLVQDEAVDGFTAAPEQQEARRDSRGSRRGSQYDADRCKQQRHPGGAVTAQRGHWPQQQQCWRPQRARPGAGRQHRVIHSQPAVSPAGGRRRPVVGGHQQGGSAQR